MKRTIHLLVWLLSGLVLKAQNGDRPGETQLPPPSHIQVPPAPVISPAEALKSFTVAPGFQVELVAAEPLVVAPVSMTFDPAGRLWVLEMPGFMPTPDGKGEDQPVGRVVILTDTNGDGQMDKREVFLDGLVMPRALALVRDGCLVAEPPHLWFARDTNGDHKADEKTEIFGDYGSQTNPEHTSNSPLLAMDNWIYSANHTNRYRFAGGRWTQEGTIFRGQWGLTQDDFGRLFFNSNSDQLRGDFVPTEYLSRNPHYRSAAGGNVQIAQSQAVWPIRVTTGVNRGYQSGVLRDGKLTEFTAACAPLIYRGDMFPAEYRGNAFLCEPSAYLIRRNILQEQDGMITGTNAYVQAEFLASTDERFRPVNLANGPDGGLYVVDMHRGILQHKIYMTSYLRKQVEERQLDQGLTQGRIYRVVPVQHKRSKPTKLDRASARELVNQLESDNGWVRDTAQRLLVEKADPKSMVMLEKLAATSRKPLARLHALWCLEGIGQLRVPVLEARLLDAYPKVRAAAVRLSDPFVKDGANRPLLEKIALLRDDAEKSVRLQVAFTLGMAKTPWADAALKQILKANADHTYIRDAVITGLEGRELALLEQLLEDPEWSSPAPGRDKVLASLTAATFQARSQASSIRLLDLAAAQPESSNWKRTAVLDGLASLVPAAPKGKPAPNVKFIEVPAEPLALVKLRKQDAVEKNSKLSTVSLLYTWPGKVDPNAAKPARALTAEEQKRFDAGKELYIITCGACHQPHGNGQEGLAPPLVDSEWTLGSPARLGRIVIHGLRGPIHVKGKVFALDMPALGILDDEQIAALLTYVRREWGHTADPVAPDFIKQLRETTSKREEPWTEADLLRVP